MLIFACRFSLNKLLISNSFKTIFIKILLQVHAIDEKGPEDFKKTLKTLNLPLKSQEPLPFTSEQLPAKPEPEPVAEVTSDPSQICKVTFHLQLCTYDTALLRSIVHS